VVLEPLDGLLVTDALEGFLRRLEVGVELRDQVAQRMLQHSAHQLPLTKRMLINRTLEESYRYRLKNREENPNEDDTLNRSRVDDQDPRSFNG